MVKNSFFRDWLETIGMVIGSLVALFIMGGLVALFLMYVVGPILLAAPWIGFVLIFLIVTAVMTDNRRHRRY